MDEEKIVQPLYEVTTHYSYNKLRPEFSYTQITRIHETERCFYIIVDRVGGLIAAKKSCSAELMEYIRGLSPKRKK